MRTSRENGEQDRPATPATAASQLVEVDGRPRPSCQATDDDEPMGGDPPCWAHLFEDDLTDQDR